jgi:hypothetical protein
VIDQYWDHVGVETASDSGLGLFVSGYKTETQHVNCEKKTITLHVLVHLWKVHECHELGASCFCDGRYRKTCVVQNRVICRPICIVHAIDNRSTNPMSFQQLAIFLLEIPFYIYEGP